MAENRPAKVLKLGGIEIAEWEKESADGKTYRSFSFQKSYKTKDGKWEHTTSFLVNDLPTLASLILTVLGHKTTIIDPNMGAPKQEVEKEIVPF